MVSTLSLSHTHNLLTSLPFLHFNCTFFFLQFLLDKVRYFLIKKRSGLKSNYILIQEALLPHVCSDHPLPHIWVGGGIHMCTHGNYKCALRQPYHWGLKGIFLQNPSPPKNSLTLTHTPLFLLKLCATRTDSKNNCLISLLPRSQNSTFIFFLHTHHLLLSKRFRKIFVLKGTLRDHLGGSFTMRLNMINAVNKDIFTMELTAFLLQNPQSFKLP